MCDSWEDFQMSKIEPEVVKYPSGLFLRQRNGGSRYLNSLETIMYSLFGYIPADKPWYLNTSNKIKSLLNIKNKRKDELVDLLLMATKKEKLRILKAPNENRFFIQGYAFKRNLTGWETFLFVIFDIEPKEVRESKD